MNNRNYLSPVICERIPKFIPELYPEFFQFLEYYYQFLEETGNPLQVLEDFEASLEINNQVDNIVGKILEEMGFPSTISTTIPKSQVIQFLRDFYLCRGSINSFKFFFRLLYNDDIEISYPREQMFIPSVATYTGRFFVFTTANTRNTTYYNQLVQKNYDFSLTIRGVSSKTVCSIDSIDVVMFAGKFYLKIQIESNIQEFSPYEGVEIFINGSDTKITEVIVGVLDLTLLANGSLYKVGDIINVTGCPIRGIARVKSISNGYVKSITISQPGTGYSVGDQITALQTVKGHSFSAQVYKVSDTGAITQTQMFSPGYDYEETPSLRVISKTGLGAVLTANSDSIGQIKSIEFVEPYADVQSVGSISVDVTSDNGSGATFTPTVRTIFSERKSFQDQKGFLGSNCVISDSDFYQQFSYEITSSIPQNDYQRVVDDFLHPPGFVRFARVVITYDETLINDYDTGNDFYIGLIISLYDTDSSFSLSWTTDFTIEEIIELANPALSINNINNLEFYKVQDSYTTQANRWDFASLDYIHDDSHTMNDALDVEIEIVT